MPRLLRRIGRTVDELEASPRFARGYATTLGRDPPAIATDPPEAILPWPVSSVSSAVRSTISEVEDGRFFSPTTLGVPTPSSRISRPGRPARPAVSLAPRISPGGQRATWATQLSYPMPKSVAVCVRRKLRKAVLLALGKGGGRHRRGRRNNGSNIWC